MELAKKKHRRSAPVKLPHAETETSKKVQTSFFVGLASTSCTVPLGFDACVWIQGRDALSA